MSALSGVGTRRSKLAFAASVYLALIAMTAVFLFPLLWVVSLSLRPMAELFAFPPRMVPQHPTLAAYTEVLTGSPVARPGPPPVSDSTMSKVLNVAIVISTRLISRMPRSDGSVT